MQARRRSFAVGLAAGVTLSIPTAHATWLDTQWLAGDGGDWSDASNWSAGEPTSDHLAEIPPNSRVDVLRDGETCGILQIGSLPGSGAGLWISGGSLSVSHQLLVGSNHHVAAAYAVQIHGTLSAGLVRIATASELSLYGGHTTMAGCEIDGGHVRLVGSADLTIAENVHVATGSRLTLTGGTLSAGTAPHHQVVVRGVLTLSGPCDADVRHLAFEGAHPVLRVVAGASGLGTIRVDGALTLAGRLVVEDDGAAPGEYTVATAATIAGAFTEVVLPPGDSWRYRAENGALTVVRPPPEVPADRVSWSALKQRFAD